MPDAETGSVKATVKVDLFRGRELPPWDRDTGALDAYAKITLGGTTLTSR